VSLLVLILTKTALKKMFRHPPSCSVHLWGSLRHGWKRLPPQAQVSSEQMRHCGLPGADPPQQGFSKDWRNNLTNMSSISQHKLWTWLWRTNINNSSGLELRKQNSSGGGLWRTWLLVQP
jgi:hypothetical protein